MFAVCVCFLLFQIIKISLGTVEDDPELVVDIISIPEPFVKADSRFSEFCLKLIIGNGKP